MTFGDTFTHIEHESIRDRMAAIFAPLERDLEEALREVREAIEETRQWTL